MSPPQQCHATTPRGPSIALSVVSPVYGCAGCLEALVERIEAALHPIVEDYEIILVDDGSPDAAWARIEELCAQHPRLAGIRLTRNFGQHPAIFAGIEYARGRHVAVLDCDLQDLPEQLPLLYATALEGNDAVFARRHDRRDSGLKRLGSALFFRILSYLTGVPQDAATANFGVFSRRLVDSLARMPEVERCFPLMVKWTGFRRVSIDVEHGQRLQGRSSYSLRKLIRLALGIILSYSDKPLRMVVKLGLWFAAFAFAFAAYSVFRYISGDIAVAGFTSIIASIWLVGGAITASLGIVGLYVGRIFNDVKSRPYYLVDRMVGGDTTAGASRRAD